MAVNTNAAYQSAIYDQNKNQYLKIYINNVEIDDAYVRDIELDDPVFETDNFTLGSTTIGKITIEFDNVYLESIDPFDSIYIEQIVETEESEEIIPIGTYYLTTDPENNDDNYTKYTFYDILTKLDKENVFGNQFCVFFFFLCN